MRDREQDAHLRRLRQLHTDGTLAAAYPAVRGLLAPMDGAGLAAAGALLSRLDPGEVLEHHPGTPVVRVTISAGRAVTGPVVAPLAAELARHGLLLHAELGEFNGWISELADPAAPLRAHRPDLALCLLDPFTVLEGLPAPWRLADAEHALSERLELLTGLTAGYSGQGPGTLVLNTVPLLRRFSHQLVDLASRAAFGAAWREFNAGLLRLSRPGDGVAVLDLDPVAASGARADDPRLSLYTSAPYGAGLLAGYAREVAHLARTLRGDTKKCLVLDLDGTLWDGVLDEGDGVRVGGSTGGAQDLRGRAFGELQGAVKQLSDQGVLLAVSSKNDEQPVRTVLREHPGMLLREADFAAIRAGWGPKHESLAQIADGLGLGSAALVFADDSPAERALVTAALPGTAVLPFDAEPALHVDRLLADGWFDTLQLTEDDRERPARYRGRQERTELRERLLDHRAYLHSLEVVVRLSPATAQELPRIAQLTLRTNRLNATGGRWTTAEVRERAASGRVLAIRAADRFGDEGLAGVLFVSTGPDTWTLDNLVLSCRVLGREVEDACLTDFVDAAYRAGAGEVRARWRPTRSNSAVRELYLRHGFVPRGGPADGDSGSGSVDVLLCRAPARHGPPGHIRLEREGAW
ncbi:HAD-IIIC family phosphatase [Streptomyces sp. H10-C2]|uniref:HAD-IIIC family phosphatase n=1 Tax=unclassified Streptomyces TaxID=2593676 RepID=UPI0024B8F2A8|nr:MULTISPECIES: HAD-IIIC family phosphatase [unclassified Streptomyces]MDJ0341806.1 HAD-IIIC family phosphatase [Streptomyces sp. PH10-H1]MDJ0370440.1 HAD-IIIC family phosphatase [Streptomyces sp. H10-C2]